MKRLLLPLSALALSTLFGLGDSAVRSEILDQPAPLRSRAEVSEFRETSRYADVTDFLEAIASRTKRVQVKAFGTSREGRPLPLVILSEPAIKTPESAHRSGKLRVFVMANIHAGEVEGKEASLHLIREIALGPLRPLLKDLIILFAPIYNADGNERVSINNRPDQKGPVGGVGVRENAEGLDLNRDFMKLETPEANGLVGEVLNRWDPQLIVDLHTTNGSYHGYALTYAPPLHPGGDERLIQMTREEILPAIRKEMLDRYRYQTYFYGNFIDEHHPEKGWKTFDHRPRFGNNYIGLRNRLTILSEAYAYLDFRARIEVTQKFVQSILEYAARHARVLSRAVAEADHRMRPRRSGKPAELGLRFANRPLPEPVEILGNEVISEIDPETNAQRFRRTDAIISYRTQDFGIFEATEMTRFPHAYYIPSGQMAAVEKLRAHGIMVERMPARLKAKVEVFRVNAFKPSDTPFQRHHETSLSGDWFTEVRVLPAGSFRVRTSQPLGRLAFYLLEPESDDGLVDWNFFDTAVREVPVDFPVYRSRP
ncbi:MAG: M14 family metallopeptidase [Acidobacteria bacterium]|nr:M14 family metallopeptidase [Acidobacteriota bacterium]